MALDFTQANNALVTKEALNHTIGVIDAIYLRKTEKSGFKIAKLTTPEAGFASSYKLTTAEGADIPGSAVINLAKDMMLQDVDLLTCAEADKPLAGYVVGDKYFDFMVYTAAEAAEGETGVKHLYVKVSELVDAYTSGNAAINITADNKVSLVIDETNANGLEVGANGLRLNLATTTAAGAMSAADKTRLGKAVINDDITTVTTTDVDAMFTALGVTVPTT